MSKLIQEFDASATVRSIFFWIQEYDPQNAEFIFAMNGDGQPVLAVTYDLS